MLHTKTYLYRKRFFFFCVKNSSPFFSSLSSLLVLVRSTKTPLPSKQLLSSFLLFALLIFFYIPHRQAAYRYTTMHFILFVFLALLGCSTSHAMKYVYQTDTFSDRPLVYPRSFCDPNHPVSVTACFSSKKPVVGGSASLTFDSTNIRLNPIKTKQMSDPKVACYTIDSCALWNHNVPCKNPTTFSIDTAALNYMKADVVISEGEIEQPKLSNNKATVHLDSVSTFLVSSKGKRGICARLPNVRYLNKPAADSKDPRPWCEYEPSGKNNTDDKMIITYLDPSFNHFTQSDLNNSTKGSPHALNCKFFAYTPDAPWNGAISKLTYAITSLFCITFFTLFIH